MSVNSHSFAEGIDSHSLNFRFAPGVECRSFFSVLSNLIAISIGFWSRTDCFIAGHSRNFWFLNPRLGLLFSTLVILISKLIFIRFVSDYLIFFSYFSPFLASYYSFIICLPRGLPYFFRSFTVIRPIYSILLIDLDFCTFLLLALVELSTFIAVLVLVSIIIFADFSQYFSLFL